MKKMEHSQYINAITIDKFEEENFNNESLNSQSLTNLKTVNLFVGANNSGKSRLIRHIYKNKILSIDSDSLQLESYKSHVVENIKKIKDESYINPEDYLHNTLNELAVSTAESIDSGHFCNIKKEIDEFIMTAGEGLSFSNRKDESTYYKEIFKDLDEHIEFEFIKPIEIIFNKCYLPILRGLRPLNNLKEDDEHIDLNLKRTIDDYDLSCSHNEKNKFISNIIKNNRIKNIIFTGYSIYSDLVELLMGGYEKRSKLENYEYYLSKNFFKNEKVTLSPIEGKDVVSIKIGNADERPIYELGDGLQTVIIITFPVFTAPRPTLFFIEEPETHLHAGYQRGLIETLASQTEHKFFISTHSNHIIDIVQERDDISIQRVFQKIEDDKHITCIDSLSKEAELLYDLGVRPSSVFLANCSIWVEGITDKLYLREYMKKYICKLQENDKKNKLKNLKEDLHYIFTEYQGSNITHWYFGEDENYEEETTSARKLCSKAFLLADGDIQAKGKRVEELKRDLNDSFKLLDFKEIENYIPEAILKLACNELWNSFNSKGESKFNLDAINQDDYANMTGIGAYLETFVSSQPSDRKFFESNSGTIKDKVKLCRIATRMMNERDDWELTPQLSELCESIYAHILRCNYG
ncbi:AAA family ATPase [Photobacterium rosenbergii]|nr:ATP-binding protein [Photobacterium rosenbergii]